MSIADEAHRQIDTTVSVLTNPASTAVSSGAGVAVWITQHAPPVIALLTITVLIAQVIGWCYKLYRWYRCNKEKGEQ